MCPWPSICIHGPSNKFSDLLPPASLPPVQKRAAQHTFLRHKGAHTDENGPFGTPFLTPKSPRKKLCGSPFCVLSQEMRHIIFFLGAQNGVFWVGVKKFMLKKSCAFRPPKYLRDGFFSDVGVRRSYALAMRIPNPSPILDKTFAPMDTGFYPALGLGLVRPFTLTQYAA